MGKRVIIDIKESEEELDKLYRVSRNYKVKNRIKSLQLTKRDQFHTRVELAKHLSIDSKTLYVWMRIYQQQGIEALLKSTSGGKHRKVVPNSLKELLDKKLKDSSNPLKGYTDAVLWAKKELNIDVNYQTLRSFMIANF
jgi:transposase